LVISSVGRKGRRKDSSDEKEGDEGRRRKQLLDEFKGKRRCCKLGEEELDRTVLRNRFRGLYAPLVKETEE
jgi:hypothetical protein